MGGDQVLPGAHGGRPASTRKARSEFRLRELLTHTFLDHVERHVLAPGELESVLERIAAREIDPYSAAADILRKTVKQSHE